MRISDWLSSSCDLHCVPYANSPPASSHLYVGQGKSYSDRRGSRKSSDRGRGQGRSTPSATITKPGQSKEGQTTMAEGMWEQISLMLQKNAVTEVPPNSPGFYSNLFLVCKASGGWRPVIDLKV